jgi:EAL domain-containing protein (putative c-di-GMP-specific phosphodiesterase class I)
MNHSDHDRQVKIMREIVNLAATLDAQVVCEGVENSDDVELMHEIGAYVAQGYFYARPIPERDFESQLSRK